MKFTRESEYGLNALLFLAQQPPGRVLPLSEIALGSRLPENFLAKIFQKLAHHDVVRSFRGARRGYTLARQPGDITIRELLEAVEGAGVLERCIFSGQRCGDDEPCRLHEGWSRVRPDLVRWLDHTTLEDLARSPVARAESGGGKAR